jgi:hypothetical protein
MIINNVLVPAELLQKVLDYVIEAESTHFEESSPSVRENHIFTFATELQACLNSQA